MVGDTCGAVTTLVGVAKRNGPIWRRVRTWLGAFNRPADATSSLLTLNHHHHNQRGTPSVPLFRYLQSNVAFIDNACLNT